MNFLPCPAAGQAFLDHIALFADQFDVEHEWRRSGVAGGIFVSGRLAHGAAEEGVEALQLGGRFGAHNLHPSFPSTTSAQLKNTFVGTFFNGGVRLYRLFDTKLANAPPRIKEIGYYIPAAPAKNQTRTIQMNHAIVDENGLIYANDRGTGGLYILRYTGKEPLD